MRNQAAQLAYVILNTDIGLLLQPNRMSSGLARRLLCNNGISFFVGR